MPVYEITPPIDKIELDAGRVQEFLIARGVVVEWVAVRTREDGTVYYAVSADSDPLADIESYVKPVRQEDTARSTLVETFPKLMDGTATATEVRRALAALIVLFRENFR